MSPPAPTPAPTSTPSPAGHPSSGQVGGLLGDELLASRSAFVGLSKEDASWPMVSLRVWAEAVDTIPFVPPSSHTHTHTTHTLLSAVKKRRPHYQAGEGRPVIMGTRFCTHGPSWPGPPLTPWTPPVGDTGKRTDVIVSFAPSGLSSSCQKLSGLSARMCLSYGGNKGGEGGKPLPSQPCVCVCMCVLNSGAYSSYLADGSAAPPTALHSWPSGGFSLSTVTLCNLGFT